MQKIILFNKEINFYPTDLSYSTSKIIDKEVAIRNLADATATCKEYGLAFIISYGTLLGCIREQKLIDYDIDLDISFFDEEKFVSLLPVFEAKGFKLIRFIEKDTYSLIKESVYIDFYVLKEIKESNTFRKLFASLFLVECGLLVPKFLFKFRKVAYIDNVSVPIPMSPKVYLSYIYGRGWKTPKQNCPGAGALGYSKATKRLLTAMMNSWFGRN
jgi:hypothetical protein